jgi:hypothetical protein
MGGYAHDYTYFVYCPHCGQMKIGGTGGIAGRRARLDSEHRATCPRIWPWPHRQSLRLIAAFDEDWEPYFHRQFLRSWTYGEWFLYENRMRAWLIAHGITDAPPVPPWTPDAVRRIVAQPKVRKTGGRHAKVAISQATTMVLRQITVRPRGAKAAPRRGGKR